MSNYDALLRSFGPSAWWKLADAVGSSTAADSSGNGYVGTVNGGVTFGQPGPIASTPADTAALFDQSGAVQYISTGLAVPVGGDFTALAWGYPETGLGGDLLIARSGYDACGILSQSNSDGTISFGATVYTGGNNYNFESAHRPMNAWYFVVASYSATAGMTLYVNGAVAMSEPTWTGGNTLVADWSIGDTTGNWTGLAAQCAPFPTALSAAQIAALWSPPPLVSGGSGWPHLVYR